MEFKQNQFFINVIGKPGPPEDVNISKSQVDEFTLDWTPPNGKIPSHCLEYEIQYKDQTDTWKVCILYIYIYF